MGNQLFYNAAVHTPPDEGHPLSGGHQGRVRTYHPGALWCRDALVVQAGPEARVRAALSGVSIDAQIDCGGRCLIPGFVDPHTHMCFAETRETEFSMRLAGRSYLEILEGGGGILSSVRSVRGADEETLYERTRDHVLTALGLGTTTVEIKSGYGLDTPSELKMLRVIERVGRDTPLDVVPTFLGAHAVPENHRGRAADYVQEIVAEMLPAVAAQGIARYCDVFCEQGVFTRDQSRYILQKAGEFGLGLKMHADEVHDLGGAGLAAELEAISADHLLAATDSNLRALAEAGGIAVLLPATAYSLKTAYARARDMIAMDLPLALATDCNPGSSYTESMPFVIGLGVMKMGLTPQQALVAATINAAYAVGMARRVGSLDPGKQADFLILDGLSPAILAYHAGVSPVAAVYKNGRSVGGTGRLR